jgi:5-methylcytosine-specific restriction protein A
MNCFKILDKPGYCNKHKHLEAEAIQRKKEYFERLSLKKEEYKHLYNDSRWNKLRVKIINERRCCELCHSTQSLEVHHLIKHYGDETLFFDENNIQLLCKACHSKENARQAREGKNNPRGGK